MHRTPNSGFFLSGASVAPVIRALGTMKLDPNFVENLVAVDPRELVEQLQSDDRPHFDTYWKLLNEIKPVDLYCYLYGRFGPPNGIQNFFRGDHSENLIHWEWTLNSCGRTLLIQGHNFRTEMWVSGEELSTEILKQLIEEIKVSFPKYGAEMGRVRKALEHWVEFINPYQRIKKSIDSLLKELDALDIPNQAIELKSVAEYSDPESWSKDWGHQAEIITRATGLCFGVRSMLPVMAEAFVNLLLYMLMKPELKSDDRLRENIIRQPIDVRVKSLSHNCVGFETTIDYGHDACRRYHSLVNERNDLLHGNVVVDKLKFNEMYFNGRVPVFQTYDSMWERAFGVEKKSVGLDHLDDERKAVDEFIDYVISCLDEKNQQNVRSLSESRDLGICLDDGHLGMLFSSQLVDMVPGSRVSD
jgi:hypothetical protein